MSALATAGLLASVLLPPWQGVDPDAAERRTGTEEVELRGTPNVRGARRGTIAPGKTVRIYAAARGAGCDGKWFLVGADAWACGDALTPTDGKPDPLESEPKFYFVRAEFAQAYSSLERAGEETPDLELEKGFGVSVVKNKAKDGINWSLTTKGMWVATSDLALARVSTFEGAQLDGVIDVAWTSSKGARARKEDNDGVETKLQARLRVRLTETRGEGKAERSKASWQDAKGTHEAWLLPSELRRPQLMAPPAAALANERWVDVSLKDQTLVAYEGAKPVFATLVSTGKGGAGTPFETPKGEYRVWAKIRAITMDNLDEEEAETYYSVEDVPYVQFFNKGVALHGAYWHDLFGQRHSHGCVNLSIPDAKFLFDFSNPSIPAGWTAIHPYAYDAGLRVVVR